MTAHNSRQTRIDQYYKVVYCNNTNSESVVNKEMKTMEKAVFVEDRRFLNNKKRKNSYEEKVSSSSQTTYTNMSIMKQATSLQLPTNVYLHKSISNFHSSEKLFELSIFLNELFIENLNKSIENLNFVREGRLLLNEFELEKIYCSEKFNLTYSNNLNLNYQKFERKNITIGQDMFTQLLLRIVIDVFANPINCGYFTEDELNLIFLLFTLSSKSQMLFVKILKRKSVWHRINNIKYPEIANDLNPYFNELIQNGFCTSDLSSMRDISSLLDILAVKEIQAICRKLKIAHLGSKQLLINRLLSYGESTKSNIRGAKSPKDILYANVLMVLQPCIHLTEIILELFNRILTLLNPAHSPTESIADILFKMINIYNDRLLFPVTPREQSFPIFQNRLHLIEYVKIRSFLGNVLNCIEKKQWATVRNFGRIALENVRKLCKMQSLFFLPSFIRKFMPEYLWIKVLSITVNAFKKTPETMQEAVDILKTLINKQDMYQTRRGQWHNELALIEMHHSKNLERSASLIVSALQCNKLTTVDKLNLLVRMKMLIKRKTGISEETKMIVRNEIKNLKHVDISIDSFRTLTITANIANKIKSGGKSTWFINIDENDKYYGNVESLALYYYSIKEDFRDGLLCEGLLPTTLFAIVFWDELYNIFKPGVFPSHYQIAPLDLFTNEFFNNRNKVIEDKIKIIKSFSTQYFANWMQDRYSKFINFKSILPNNLFKTDEQFKEVVTCLGINGIIGICQKLISDYKLWRSGFPDLVLWNYLSLKCRIVEVKGPGDFLSTKQILWLHYLNELGIEIEICHIKANRKRAK